MPSYKCVYADGESFEFKIISRSGLLFMCDILGFKSIIEENCEVTVDKIIGDLICFLERLVKTKLRSFKEHDTLKDKIKDEDIKNYKLKYALISDTFLIYPNVDHNIDDAMYDVSFRVLSVIAAALFNECLSIHNILIRGTIVDGKYRILDEYNLIFGKAIIEAYEIEQMQKWGGVLLSPSVLKNIKTIHSYLNSYVEYDGEILKQGHIYNKYKIEREKYSKNNIALNWIKLGEDLKMNNKPNWTLLYENAEQIKVRPIKESVIEKITNTKMFYEYVRARMIT